MQLLFTTGQKVVSFPDPPPCSVEGGSGDETRQKVDVPLLSLSCLGAKYTTTKPLGDVGWSSTKAKILGMCKLALVCLRSTFVCSFFSFHLGCNLAYQLVLVCCTVLPFVMNHK